MRIFQSDIADLETIARLALKQTNHDPFTREHDGSDDALASARIAEVMADYRIRRHEKQRLVDLLPGCESAQGKALSPHQP